MPAAGQNRIALALSPNDASNWARGRPVPLVQARRVAEAERRGNFGVGGSTVAAQSVSIPVDAGPTRLGSRASRPGAGGQRRGAGDAARAPPARTDRHARRAWRDRGALHDRLALRRLEAGTGGGRAAG